jgi:transcriptional regulator with XRE-family HTH domain
VGEDLVVFRAQRLREARLGAGLSQVQLAAAIGTTRHEVGRWERGKFVPAPQMIPAVAAVVGVDPLRVTGNCQWEASC